MARHSHWHNIQMTKGKVDARRAQAFTKLAKGITIAAKEGGGDPSFNFKLRMAIDAAKAANMPKDNIDRAVARGVGGSDEASLETVLYEGFGPGGVAMMIEGVTDNRARTVSEVKTIMNKNGGSVGASGSVKWMFDYKAVLRTSDHISEEQELALIDAGAEDITCDEVGSEIVGDSKQLQVLREAMEVEKLTVESAGLEYIANQTVTCDAEAKGALEKLFMLLDENDDVTAVYTNEV